MAAFLDLLLANHEVLSWIMDQMAAHLQGHSVIQGK